jgi:hypothetical protein
VGCSIVTILVTARSSENNPARSRYRPRAD